jgi:hypothetical protein
MTERTVTEQQVIDAFNKHVPLDERLCLNSIFHELFPELPKVGELIKPWDTKTEPDIDRWRRFHGISKTGIIETLSDKGCVIQWLYYRRQTPAEKGEG